MKGMELLQTSFIPFIIFMSVRKGALRKLLVNRVPLGNWLPPARVTKNSLTCEPVA
jgi:hypothetical protein